MGLDDVLLADVLAASSHYHPHPAQENGGGVPPEALNHIKKNVERRGSRYRVSAELVVRGEHGARGQDETVMQRVSKAFGWTDHSPAVFTLLSDDSDHG